MISRAISIFRLLSSSSIRASVFLCVISWGIPMFWTRERGIRHRGQGQCPLSRILARRILPHCQHTVDSENEHDTILFWIVGGVSKNTGIEPPLDSIAAFNHDPMLVGFQKFIVDEYAPLCMHRFAAAVCHKCFTRRLPPCILSNKIFECVRQLQQPSEIKNSLDREITHSLKIGDMVA